MECAQRLADDDAHQEAFKQLQAGLTDLTGNLTCDEFLVCAFYAENAPLPSSVVAPSAQRPVVTLSHTWRPVSQR
jgi:hypothetical protein